MAKLRKAWGFIRCRICKAFARAVFPKCEHCGVKHKKP